MNTNIKTLIFVIVANLTFAVNAQFDEDFYLDNVIIFGDSLFDSGNFSSMTFTNQNADGSYGNISIDIFTKKLGLKVTPAFANGNNYAVGGYTSAEILASITAPGGSRLLRDHDNDLSTPDIDLVAARNGYLRDNPRISSKTLVMVSGGNNDFLDGLISDLTSIQKSVTNLATGIAALSAAGANYIFVQNIPNIALTPATTLNGFNECNKAGLEIGTDACNAVVAQTRAASLSAVQTYNSVLAASANNLDANIIPIDLFSMQTNLIANPEQFGYDNSNNQLYTTCYINACEHPIYGATKPGKDAEQLLFNDGVHPTQKGQRLIASVMLDALTAPSEVALLPMIGLKASLQQRRAINEYMQKSRWHSGRDSEQEQLHWFMSNNQTANVLADNGAAANANLMANSFNFGFDFGVGNNVRTAFMLSYNNSTINIDNSRTQLAADSYGVAAFVGLQPKWFFIESSASIYSTSYHNDRSVLLDTNYFNVKSNPDGFSWNLSTTVGLDLGIKSANFTVAPFASYILAEAGNSAFAEKNSPIANYKFASLNYKKQQLHLGITGELFLNKQIDLYSELILVNNLHNKQYSIDTQNINSKFNYYTLPGYLAQDNNYIEFNLSTDIDIEIGRIFVKYTYETEHTKNYIFTIGYSMPLN